MNALAVDGVFDNVVCRWAGTIATLQGQVARPAVKAYAERLVQSFGAAQGVVNQIEVLPPCMEDDRIRLAVYRAIYGHRSLRGYALRKRPPIHIIVKNGAVALEGAVATEEDKSIATAAALRTPGVAGLTSNLRVERE